MCVYVALLCFRHVGDDTCVCVCVCVFHRRLSKGIEIPSKSPTNILEQRSSSAPNVHNIINDPHFHVSSLLVGEVENFMYHTYVPCVPKTCPPFYFLNPCVKN